MGDLAVLYNAPRAATVIAKEDSVLWSIDRNCFTHLVKNAAQTAVARRVAFLKEVPLLKGLTPDEVSNLCDALVVKYYPEESNIITEGENGKQFFIVESGSCEARKNGETVFTYHPKDYFGERALLKDCPRAASVVTIEATTVLVL